VSAFFFGPRAKQRFGYIHDPSGGASGAVLICPSWGPEYQYAHRALRVLAKRLSERGRHVLRFDYSGTGDSWGDTTDASFAAWQDDVDLACRQLRERAGTSRIDVIGLRLGAALACGAAATRDDVRRLVLWDPVTDGNAWIAERGSRTPADPAARTVEFAESVISSRLLDDFGSLDPTHFPAARAEDVLLLRTGAPEDHAPLPETGVFAQTQPKYVADALPWSEDDSIWSGQVPAKVIRTLVDWICA
jgi:pimeloyl-ACP methyl ester carboxylesterase